MLLTVLSSAFIGIALMYFSAEIANLFKRSGSVNLIRGLDNPWTYKTLGFVIAFVYPLYGFVLSYIATAL